MLQLTDVDIMQFVGQYGWPLIRIGALFMAMPIIGTRIVSVRVRVVLAVAVTLIVVPLLPPLPAVAGLSLQSLMIVVQQVLIGLAMGFVLQVVFQLFVLGGQFIAMKMGLGFASMNDPANGVVVTVVSQYYLILTTLLFLSVNGHLVVIEVLVESFNTLPIAATGLTAQHFFELADLGAWMFTRATLIALPVLTSLLVVNLAFGVMSRAAPQMNVFAVGFPITLILGLLLMWLSLVSFLPNYQLFIGEGFAFLHQLAGTR
ncbi:flagellar type III secretion system protein FliR [Exilibacterium tricleocarpae]|uniref:Flagellar biosynthetic protein FliR n=1 Tax=Exilibacterium tricleocarpae TaxID=2591008 RepID=A0A545U3Y2_9GAMM|nr:flagellar biosynthetic protein FliR [Exilibacterium tricleocarpae]TQV84185.1 flagellar type III secretion system protein FliR [Exilibacterium tricleocarpae]